MNGKQWYEELQEQGKEPPEPIKVEDVTSVYSGREPNGCWCGCTGTYYYPTRVKDEGKKLRGYEIDPDEVNDRMVRKVVGIINANLDKVTDLDGAHEIYVFEVHDRRVYGAFLRNTRLEE